MNHRQQVKNTYWFCVIPIFRDSINSDVYGANLFNKFLSNPTSGLQESSLYLDMELLNGQSSGDHMLDECISILVNTGVHRSTCKINHQHSPRDFLPLDEDLCRPNYETKDFGAAVNLIQKKENFYPQWSEKSCLHCPLIF